MKTAVSIPDDLFTRADDLAAQLGKNRSELYRAALQDYVSRHDPQTVTSALNEIADEIDGEDRAFVATAAHHALARSEW